MYSETVDVHLLQSTKIIDAIPSIPVIEKGIAASRLKPIIA